LIDRATFVAIVIAVGVAAAGCFAHAPRGNPVDGADPDAPMPPPVDASVAEPAPPPAACELDDGIPPGRLGPGMPRVSAPDNVAAKSAEVTVELGADGTVRVLSSLVLANAGHARAEARVGYAFRLHGGQGEVRPADAVVFSGGYEVRRCAAASRPELQAVYRDETAFAVVPIAAGAEARVQSRAEFRLGRAVAPMTLFGQEDVFGQNQKNFSWSYLRDPAYEPIADRAEPFYGAIDLTPADSLRVTITTDGNAPWLRGLSYEQKESPVMLVGARQLRFDRADAPSSIALEYNPTFDLEEELAAFRKLVAARPTDLRAAIRVADLLRFGGDAAERAEVLEKLLAAWGAGAEAQLLTGRNDVRPAMYVALVRALESSGRSTDAKARAREGLAVAAALDPAADANRLAVRWLRRYLGEQAD
jgi:hypothetical protein